MELRTADLRQYLAELGYAGNFSEQELRELAADVQRRMEREDANLSLFRRNKPQYEDGPFQRPQKAREARAGQVQLGEQPIEQYGDEPAFERPTRARDFMLEADIDNISSQRQPSPRVEPQKVGRYSERPQEFSEPRSSQKDAGLPQNKPVEDFALANLDRLANEILGAKQYKTYDKGDYVGQVIENQKKYSAEYKVPRGVQPEATQPQRTLQNPKLVHQTPTTQAHKKQDVAKLQHIARQQAQLYEEQRIQEALDVLEQMPGYEKLSPARRHQYLQAILDSKVQPVEQFDPQNAYEDLQSSKPRHLREEEAQQAASKPNYQQMTLLQQQAARRLQEYHTQNQQPEEGPEQPKEERGFQNPKVQKALEEEVEIHNQLGLYVDSRGQMRKKGTDPVALNAYYKRCWQMQGAPEERRQRIWTAKADAICDKAFKKRAIEKKQDEFLKAQGVDKRPTSKM